MEDVERREAHYGQGVLHSRHGLQILLQYMHQVTKGINLLLGDPGGTQEGRGKGKPQVFQGEDHLAHCVPKKGTNAGRRCNLQIP